jgi:alanine racemase
LKIPLISIAASAAATMLPESHFTCVRVGIEMYGLWPSRGVELWCKRSKKTRGFKLKPALSMQTRLIHIKRVKAGAYIGYGSSFQAPTAMTIGVVPVGYYEGLPRSLSNMGFALLNGAVIPVVGRVCMNMTIFDISRRPRAKMGDEVVLIGQSKNKSITATDIADWAGTINYEVVSRIPDHIERIYKS